MVFKYNNIYNLKFENLKFKMKNCLISCKRKCSKKQKLEEEQEEEVGD